MKKQTQWTIVIVVAVVAIAGLFVGLYYGVIRDKPEDGEKTVTLQIVYADGDIYEWKNLKTEKKRYLAFLIEKNQSESLGFEYETSVYGAYITKLLNTPDGYGGAYYGIVINGTDAVKGISDIAVRDGDTIRIELRLYSPPDGITWQLAPEKKG